MKFTFDRETQLASLRSLGWTIANIKNSTCIVAWHEAENGKVSVKGWRGKANKPSFYYLFKNRERAEAHVAEWSESERKYEEQRQKDKGSRNPLRSVADIYAKACKDGNITCAEAAVCLRAVLGREFPGVKFSVRSDRCIRVSWTDGPSAKAVKRIASCYAGEGFDGMIDLRYSIKRWLSRDGSMSLAHSQGTEGSRGSEPEAIGSAHNPDAVLVNVGSDFVFTDREISEPIKRQLAAEVCRTWGIELPELPDTTSFERFLNTTYVPKCSHWLSTLVYQASCKEEAIA